MRKKPMMNHGTGEVNGTEPKRFLFLDDMNRTGIGCSSTRAGPMFEPMVPAMKSSEVTARTALRTGEN
jgi:hypothetical protein